MSSKQNNSHNEDWRSIPDKEIYESWGSKFHMGLSYGIKPWDDNAKEDLRDIIDAFKKADWEERQESKQN